MSTFTSKSDKKKFLEAGQLAEWFMHIPRLHFPFFRIGWKKKRARFIKLAGELGYELVIPADADYAYTSVLIRTCYETSIAKNEE